MSREEKHGATGRMILRRDWEESSSSHFERQDDYELVASDEQTVVLVHTHGSLNAYRMSEGGISADRYPVSVNDLIDLIRTHAMNGKKKRP